MEDEGVLKMNSLQWKMEKLLIMEGLEVEVGVGEGEGETETSY